MFDNLLNGLTGSLKSLTQANPLSAATPFRNGTGSVVSPFSPGNGMSGGTPFRGNAFGSGGSPFTGGFNTVSPFRNPFGAAGSPFGGTFGAAGSPFGRNPLAGSVSFNPYVKPTTSAGTTGTNPDGTLIFTGGEGNPPPEGVLRWAEQAKQTFGDLIDPDVMLAIMTNESGGDPNAYNAEGDAWGLFQQVGLRSNDANAQFAAARKLLQDKLAGISQSYAANGLNPDARTRARDVALAWAGHFDYQTGRPNPSSRDVGSGQTAEQLSIIFLKNYDGLKAGKVPPTTPVSTGGGGKMRLIWGGVDAPITQEFGNTPYSNANPYNYGADFGQGSGHHGLDIGLSRGTKLYSPVSGTITIAGGSGYYTSPGDNPGTSGEVRIRLDNGHEVILGHTSQINVRPGQRVKPGDFLGLSGGSDGDHLHLEYRVPDATLNSGQRAVDPRLYLK